MARPERLVVLVNDLTVRGRLRLQKYGFIAAHLYGNDLLGLDFYRDWKPYHHGPYSHDLADDVQFCVDAGILDEARQTTQDGRTIHVYALRPKGRKILRNLASESGSVARDLCGKLARLDERELQGLLRDAYDAHPQYAASCAIGGGFSDGAATDADDYDRFNPEIEKTLKSIDSGTYAAKRYTPDKYMEHIGKIFEK